MALSGRFCPQSNNLPKQCDATLCWCHQVRRQRTRWHVYLQLQMCWERVIGTEVPLRRWRETLFPGLPWSRRHEIRGRGYARSRHLRQFGYRFWVWWTCAAPARTFEPSVRQPTGLSAVATEAPCASNRRIFHRSPRQISPPLRRRPRLGTSR